jgi:hypothetical protein
MLVRHIIRDLCPENAPVARREVTECVWVMSEGLCAALRTDQKDVSGMRTIVSPVDCELPSVEQVPTLR